MKTSSIICILALLILFSSCTQNTAPGILLGKWEYTRCDMAAGGKDVGMSTMKLERFEAFMSNFTLEYFGDQTFYASGINGTEFLERKGTYKVREGKFIETKSTGEDGIDLVYTDPIILLTSDSLKLGMADKWVVVYSRVK
ncbi:MAG: hypothetical protein SH856_05775 [Flavobacteriales bacterium]|nr:hypothetical protein [Flavobacteriales bacterium]